MHMIEMIAHDPISRTWGLERRAQYVNFSQNLMHSRPLLFTIGKGGMSYYLALHGEQIFVCHFNAKPRANRDDLGFADFRYDALRQHLDVDMLIAAIRQAAPPEVTVKPNKLWCSLQFPLTSAAAVANLLREQIVVKLLSAQA